MTLAIYVNDVRIPLARLSLLRGVIAPIDPAQTHATCRCGAEFVARGSVSPNARIVMCDVCDARYPVVEKGWR